MKNTNKKGFTIVELLMVVAVLAVLTGIITTAASSAIKQARARRTDAAKATLQNGIAAYYAQHNYWPPKGGALDKWSENGLTGGKHVAYLDDTAYDALVYELLRVSVGSSASSPVMDPSGMLVASKSVGTASSTSGQEFKQAVAKNKRHGATIKLSQMTAGYADSGSGHFRRFVIQYNADTDSVKVMTQGDYNNTTHLRWPNTP